MSQANTKPVSAQVLDAAIAWQLCLDCGNGSAVEQAEFAKWYSASEEHARAWLQLGMLDQRFSNTGIPARNALLNARNGVQQAKGFRGEDVGGIGHGSVKFIE